MVTGKIVRFDEVRGYGFAAPDTGGEDVFVHVNDLEVDKTLIAPGVEIEFTVEGGDRGLKASGVRIANGATPIGRVSDNAEPDDGLCDVLPTTEFASEVTELLLTTAPSMTGEQIIAVRRALVKLAAGHSWVEG